MSVTPSLSLFLLLYLLSGTGILAQTISGRVVGSEGGVEFANVTALTDSGAFVTGTSTDSLGSFVIDMPAAGSYSLRISFVGYPTVELPLRVYGDEVLDDVTLATTPGVDLATVAVNATRPQILRRADRVLFLPAGSPLTNGQSLTEFMHLLPGVFMDDAGNISINGRRGVGVMINSIAQRFTGEELKQLLNGLRAEEIERVEIIAVPGAEYSATGGGGLLNIVTQRTRLIEGFTSRPFINYRQGRYPYLSYGAFSTLRTKRADFYLNAYRYREQGYTEETLSRKNATGVTTEAQRSEDRKTTTNYQLRAGGNYDLNTRQTLGLEYVRTHNLNDVTTRGITETGQEESSFVNPFNSTSIFQNATANYTARLDTLATTVSAIADYTHHNTDEDYRYFFNDDLRGGTRLLLPATTRLYAGQLDFNRPSKGFSAGLRTNLTDRSNGFTSLAVRSSGWVPAENDRPDFDYQELVYAAYTNFERAVGKWSLKAGLRGEGTQQQGGAAGANPLFQSSHFGLYPAAFISRPVGSAQAHSFRVSYTRSLGRPDFEALNPYEYRINPLFRYRGNPALKPSTTDAIESGLTFFDTYDLSVFYQHTAREIAPVILYEAEGAILTQRNISSGTVMGTTLYAPLPLSDRFTINNTVSLYRTSYVIEEQPRLSKTTLQYQLNASYTTKFLRYLMSYDITTPSLAGNVVTATNQGLNLSIIRQLLDNRLTLQASVLDVFASRNRDAVSYWLASETEQTQRYQSRYLSLNISYAFASGKSFQNRDVSGGNREERSRLKQ